MVGIGLGWLGKLDMVEVKLLGMKSITLILRWFQEKPVGLVAGVIIIGIPGVIYGSYLLAYRNKVYPGVKVAGIILSNRSGEEAARLIGQRIGEQGVPTMRLVGEEKVFDIVGRDLSGRAPKPAEELPIVR